MNQSAQLTVLLTPGGGPGILAQLTSLKNSTRHRCRAVMADSNPASGNLFLPDVDAAYRLPLCADATYLPALCRLIERENVKFLYSGLDEEMPVLARNRDAIAAVGCQMLLPPEDALLRGLDKLLMHERLNGHVRLPRTWSLDGDFDPDKVWTELEGRIVIKVAASRGGRHIYMPEDREEYDYVLRRVRRLSGEGNLRFLAQELIEGDEFNVSTLHSPEAELIYAVSRRKFENRKNKSTTVAAVIERNETVISQAVAAVERLGLTPGFNNVEAIVSRQDGLPYLIEVNGGRTAAQDMNLVASGINLTDLLIDLVSGVKVAPIPHPRDGLAVLKIRKDVLVQFADIETRVAAP